MGDLANRQLWIRSRDKQTLESRQQQQPTDASGATGNLNFLNVSTILKAARAIAQEKDLHQLLDRLMKIAMESSGAERGILILKHHQEWQIAAAGQMQDEEIAILQPLPLRTGELLSANVVNYVAAKQAPLILDCASLDKKFLADPYIQEKQPLSILCLPILAAGELVGILYLENNLTSGAFSEDRLNILHMLANQLVDSIGQAQQQQNGLLSSYQYQAGGSLPSRSPNYAIRQADNDLYESLTVGEQCYVLDALQVGKSSLQVRVMKRLEAQGFRCVAIDVSEISRRRSSLDQWCAGFAYLLLKNFQLLDCLNHLPNWWQTHRSQSPVQRLELLFAEILPREIPQRKVIFIDSIDTMLAPGKELGSVFELLQSYANKQINGFTDRDLTFALLGIAVPFQLIQKRGQTSLNGQVFRLGNLDLENAIPLLQGLKGKFSSPEGVLEAVFEWTGGQPFLTQKLCQIIRDTPIPFSRSGEIDWIEQLVRKQILKNWESRDEPPHFQLIRDRILSDSQRAVPLLQEYRKILEIGKIPATEQLEHIELLLSGLAIKRHDNLMANNRIYTEVFNLAWVEQQLLRLR